MNFNDLPSWQKRGVGLVWEDYEKPGTNPVTGEEVTATRRRVRQELELPLGEAYEALIRSILETGLLR